FSANGRWAILGRHLVMHTVDIEQGTVSTVAPGPAMAAETVVFSQDSQTVFTLGREKVLRTYSAATGNEMVRRDAPSISEVLFALPDKGRLVTVTRQTPSMETVTDVRTGKVLQE